MATTLPVGLESMDFTLVHVHSGYEAAFNEWYEADHFYAGGVLGPAVLSGGRWLAPPDLRASRHVGDVCPFPNPTQGTNLALYFFNRPDGGRAFRDWVIPQLAALRAEGRMFEHRTPISVGFHTFDGILETPSGSTVPPHAVLDHPFQGLVATFASDRGDPPSPSPGGLPVGSRTLAFTWRPEPPLVDQPDLEPYVPVRVFLTFLVDRPVPDESWTTQIARSAGSIAGARPMWAAGFVPLVRPAAGF